MSTTDFHHLSSHFHFYKKAILHFAIPSFKQCISEAIALCQYKKHEVQNVYQDVPLLPFFQACASSTKTFKIRFTQ